MRCSLQDRGSTRVGHTQHWLCWYIFIQVDGNAGERRIVPNWQAWRGTFCGVIQGENSIIWWTTRGNGPRIREGWVLIHVHGAANVWYGKPCRWSTQGWFYGYTKIHLPYGISWWIWDSGAREGLQHPLVIRTCWWYGKCCTKLEGSWSRIAPLLQKIHVSIHVDQCRF